jgi:hypothetical protein
MVIEIISLLLTMAALQIKNLNVIVQNCYFKRNDGCLGTFELSSSYIKGITNVFNFSTSRFLNFINACTF